MASRGGASGKGMGEYVYFGLGLLQGGVPLTAATLGASHGGLQVYCTRPVGNASIDAIPEDASIEFHLGAS